MRLFFLIGLWYSSQAFGWGLHYLVTDQALRSVTLSEKPVSCEPLQGFITGEFDGLKRLFEHYGTYAESLGTKRFKKIPLSEPTVESFLRAARLNSKTPFHCVQRLFPHEILKKSQRKIAFQLLNLYESQDPTLKYEFIEAKEATPRAILTTYSDEPDWWMDEDLWEISEYGYGKMPYGPKTRSRAAAFHTAFTHENFLVKFFAPEVTEGMANQRIELMSRLSQLAFQSHHPYWGYRFAAWAIHYLEDLSQPYHSQAVPQAGWLYTLKFAVSVDKEGFKKDATQLVANRHFLFEDFESHLLSDYYQGPSSYTQHLTNALQSSVFQWEAKTPSQLTQKLTDYSVQLARETDESVVDLYGFKLTQDVKYDLAHDASYDSSSIFVHGDAKKMSVLIAELGKCFQGTGEAVRKLWTLLHSSEGEAVD